MQRQRAGWGCVHGIGAGTSSGALGYRCIACEFPAPLGGKEWPGPVSADNMVFSKISLYCWSLASGLYPKFNLCWIIGVLCFICYFQLPRHPRLIKCQGCSLRFLDKKLMESQHSAYWLPQGSAQASPLRAESLKTKLDSSFGTWDH